MTKPHIEPLAVGLAEAARMIGISRSSAYVLAKSGELPTVTIAGRMVTPVAKLRELVEGR